jgi:hypothetical protein
MMVRVSAEDHWVFMFVKCPSVYLDGVEQRHVIEADDIAGYVVRHVVDEAEKPVIDVDHYVVEKLHGIVEIFGTKQPWVK